MLCRRLLQHSRTKETHLFTACFHYSLVQRFWLQNPTPPTLFQPFSAPLAQLDLQTLLSVDPTDRHPLGRCGHLPDGSLQGADCLVDVVVDDLQVEEMAVSALQQTALTGQPLQARILRIRWMREGEG